MYEKTPKAKNYGGMFLHANATPTPIDTVNIMHLVDLASAGLLQNFTFGAGATKAITAFADYSGTVAGTVSVTSGTHGLLTGAIVTIAGTTNYNGVYLVTKIDANSFYITHAWVSNDATGNWYQGSHLTLGPDAGGV
ncbi:MAG: hypothetical protein WC776_04855, partial [Patescibacteria group bacterium]